MQNTTCTEDRIQHALDRCLDGLSLKNGQAQPWNGWSMNHWSLGELLKRDPENFLILLQQILKKTKEVQESCLYELVAPLALMFTSSLLQNPYCPPEEELLVEASEVFHGFLTWPEPYASVCRGLLSTLYQEVRAPGILYHRLVREEQGLSTDHHCSKTITVLLINPAEVPAEFLSVAEQLSNTQLSQRNTYITLIKHAFQSNLGTKYPLDGIHQSLQSVSMEVLERGFSLVTELLQMAVSLDDPNKAKGHMIQGLENLRESLGIPASNGRKSDGMLQTLPVPASKCYMFHWDKDNFDVLNNIPEIQLMLSAYKPSNGLAEEEEEEDEGDDYYEEDLDEVAFMGNGCTVVDNRASTFSTLSSLSTASKDSMFSTLSVASFECSTLSALSASGNDSDFCEDPEEESHISMLLPTCTNGAKVKPCGRLSQRFSRLFKSRSSHSLCRSKSLGSPDVAFRSHRSNSLPQQVRLHAGELQMPTLTQTVPEVQQLRHICFRRRPILSIDEEEWSEEGTQLRVVVFGADHVAGRLARAYSSLRNQEMACPRLSRAFRMRFFFVPVRRDMAGVQTGKTSTGWGVQHLSDLRATCSEDSTNDIAELIGMLDPWYEHNTLSLLNLPVDVVCQQTSKIESELYDSNEERLPILADLILYYCRNAARPVLIQLYKAELTLAGGEKRREVFIHSLELGHTAGTRAIKSMGSASKRFGIDGDREAVPLTLDVVYNRVVVSGRSHLTRAEKVCTSINLTKACRNPEELDSKMECLQLTMTEVLKRQNSKSKKGYNQQLTTTQVKVDKVHVSGVSSTTTFAVCLDQDEKKILQSVTRCDISVCYKPDRSVDWTRNPALSTQIQPLHPTFCSLLCLPISTFGGPQP
ncbi:phosphoinositide 3-kinase regulatory subunit 5 isoform X2 [Denticeps clupeoides]|uniref:phosphoinositide 3-kinase regulatory subunit 5 isoform X2 n=1 Tax=Denticeps clupeoides TaxID=299321 RepID=UPI0010A387CE|nr:phosphoinositide 3-kinase regulatory subunit 5 isoform X2 [Denticeps clupeoides]